MPRSRIFGGVNKNNNYGLEKEEKKKGKEERKGLEEKKKFKWSSWCCQSGGQV